MKLKRQHRLAAMYADEQTLGKRQIRRAKQPHEIPLFLPGRIQNRHNKLRFEIADAPLSCGAVRHFGSGANRSPSSGSLLFKDSCGLRSLWRPG
jgi:hypothetical protein